MTKSRLLLAAVVVAVVLAGQFFMRSRPPATESVSSAVPPRQELPAVDPLPAVPAPPPSAEPVPLAAVASNLPVLVDESLAPSGSDGSRRFMFNCGEGHWFGVRVVDLKANVFSLDDPGAGSLLLVQTAAASGARYAAGDAVFWNKGDVATFEIRGQVYTDCVSDPGWSAELEARRRGATFRARGNEPPWVLEITPQLLVLTTNLGARRVEFVYRAPTVAGSRTTYRMFAGTEELVVVVDRMACNDSMSGELFDHTVAVTFEGTAVYGCGRTPR